MGIKFNEKILYKIDDLIIYGDIMSILDQRI